MNDEGDVNLHDRLAGLAAAVPVMPLSASSVLVATVRGRMFALGSVAPILAVLVAGAILAGLLKIGPFAPASTLPAPTASGPGETVRSSERPPDNPSLSITDRDGDYELTIRASRMRYAAGEPIDVSASLVYRGSKQIVHVWGLFPGIGSREARDGISVGWIHTLPCAPSDLRRDVPLEVHAFTMRDVNHALLMEPLVALPEGTWHLTATAGTGCSEGPGAETFSLRAEIAIEVVAAATSGPTTEVGQDNSIHIENFDSPTIDIVMDGKSTGLLECSGMGAILSSWRWGPPPWEFEVINTWTGETMATFSLDEPLPQAIRIRNGEVLHGRWPGAFGPVPPPTCSPRL